MATAETVDMGPAHPPKQVLLFFWEESFKVFNEIESELKKTLQHLRHDHDKHEPEYFKAVSNLSDHQLTNFSSKDLKEVRIATSAYGMHLFGKVLLPEASQQPAYFMFRAFIPGEAENAKMHCVHTEEVEKPDGDKVFRAIFGEQDELAWFNE